MFLYKTNISIGGKARRNILLEQPEVMHAAKNEVVLNECYLGYLLRSAPFKQMLLQPLSVPWI